MSQEQFGRRVSNEVLEERVTNYFERIMAEIASVRKDMTILVDRHSRFEDSLAAHGDRMHTHERQPGHPETMLRLGNVETLAEGNRKDIEQLKHLADVEKHLAIVTADVSSLKESHAAEGGLRQGRAETISSADKLFLRIMILLSGISTAIVITQELAS